MVRMTGSKLLTRLLILISSVTLISLLALTRCGFGGLIDNNTLLSDVDGKREDFEQNYVFYQIAFIDTQTDSSKVSLESAPQQLKQEQANRDEQANYILLMQQRDEENRQEIAKLTAEIKLLKVQLLQHRRKLLDGAIGLIFTDSNINRNFLQIKIPYLFHRISLNC